MPAGKKNRARQADAHGRILRTATRLFQNQGYSTTGINQIISESEASKASFYYYYPSKEDLGREYLSSMSEEQLVFFRTLMEKYPNPDDFVRGWLKFLKRSVKSDDFHGCHMANFRAQLGEDRRALESEVGDLFKRTIDMLGDYLERARDAGHVPVDLDPRATARRFFAAYEGVVQIWLLSDDLSALDDLEIMARAIWKA